MVHVFQQVAGPELTPKRTIRPLGPMGMDEAPTPGDTPGEDHE